MKIIWENEPFNGAVQLIAASDTDVVAVVADQARHNLMVIVTYASVYHGISIQNVIASSLKAPAHGSTLSDVYLYEEKVFADSRPLEYGALIAGAYTGGWSPNRSLERTRTGKVLEFIPVDSPNYFEGLVLCASVTWVEDLVCKNVGEFMSEIFRQG